jgi:hypothetical protein
MNRHTRRNGYGMRWAAFALVVLAPSLTHAVVSPARFWFSLSDTQPYQFSAFGPAGVAPGAPRLEVVEGGSESIYLWARPQTDPANTLLNLQNFSLNLVLSSASSVAIDGVEVNNPPGDVTPSNNRFGVVIDSDHQQSVVTGAGVKTYPVVTASSLLRFGGFTVTEPTAVTGIGPICTGDCAGGVGAPAWLLGRIDFSGLVAGEVTGSLQVGSMSITHSGEMTPSTQVQFGDGPLVYNAALDRDVTLALDTVPELRLLVVDSLQGDYNNDNRVDAADYTVWRDTLGSTSPLDADGDDSEVVDAGDYGVWRATYGAALGGSGSVPEPGVLALMGAVAIALVSKSPRRILRAAAIGALISPMVLVNGAHAATFDVAWSIDGNGAWTNPGNWNPPMVPDNAVDTYNVTIDLLGIAPYAVSLETPITIDSLELSSANATLDLFDGVLNVNNFITPIEGTLSFTGTSPSLNAFTSNIVLNRALVSQAGGSFLGAASFENLGTVSVGSGSLTLLSLGPINNSGVFHVSNGGHLDLLPGAPFSHVGTAVISGSGTFAVDSNASGSIDLMDVFTNSAVVRPGDSPGILTIDGNYEQTASGLLEIEIGGLTAGTQHDRLVVNGSATLAGRLEMPLLVGFVPAVNDEVTILTAGGSINGGFDAIHVTDLPSGIAQRLVYNASDVRVQFVAPTTATFTATGATVSWATAFGGTAPDSTKNVSLFNNTPGIVPQTVVVSTPAAPTAPNAAHSLSVSDASDAITVLIDNTNLSVSTATTIGQNGAIEIAGAGLLATETLAVNNGGRFTGGGTILGEVSVGSVGAGAAVFDPVGTLQVEGAYTQNAKGRFAVELPSDVFSGNDKMTVTGDVTLGGVLEIDVSDLTDLEFTSGAAYDLIVTAGAIVGEFDRIDVIGRDDLYFEVTYGNAPSSSQSLARSLSSEVIENEVVRVSSYNRGDGNQDHKIDDIDARIFASMLLDNTMLTFNFNCTQSGCEIAANNFYDAFDFVDTTNDEQLTVDFFDIPRFAEALADSQSQSLATAYATIDAAMVDARLRLAVPEPAVAQLLALLGGLIAAARRVR